jgi:hypothetical protein
MIHNVQSNTAKFFIINVNQKRNMFRRFLDQCFSTCVRPRPGKFFFYKTRARAQQIYRKYLTNFFKFIH